MQVDISNLAYIAGEILGVGEFVGGVFVTMTLYTIITGILLVLAKDKLSSEVLIVEGLLVVGFCTAIGWVGYWLLAFIGLGLLAIVILFGLGKLGGNK